MEAWVDLYNILKVHERADRSSIEAMYRALCKEFHPDINHSPEAEGRMKEINMAWEVLGDEHRRREYHNKWMLRNGLIAPARSSAGAASAGSASSAWQRAATARQARSSPQEDAAYAAIRRYFTSIAAGRFEEAYSTLCQQDQNNVPLDSFTAWQTSVAAAYRVERLTMLNCREYPQSPVGDASLAAKRVVVEIVERNLRTGEWSRYKLTKFAVKQADGWRVYLGYRNLDFVIEQFSVLSGTAVDAIRRTMDLSCGLPNRLGFLERCKAEAYRYERYGRDCAMAVATISIARDAEREVRERILVQAGCALRAAVRLIDLVGSLGDGRYAVLMAECGAEQSRGAAKRIGRKVEREIFACFDSPIRLHWHIAPYTGEGMEATLRRCES